MPFSYSTDIVIFGGGVAGLWLLNRLTGAGYRTVLLENHRLGGGQSINSQGIIHGGLKYALHGALSGASRAIADMPARWRACVDGRGEIDLSACKLLSPHFQLWSGAGLGAEMKAFLGSKAIAGKAEPAARNEVPEFLRGRGKLYRLPDFVVDPRSLIETLAAPHSARIHAIDRAIEFRQCGDGRLLHTRMGGGSVRIKARRYVFCAGEGNGRLIRQSGLSMPPCQSRPLKMVAVSGAMLAPVFLHALGEGLRATPRLTLTSHRNGSGAPVWYLGGELAEAGVNRSDARQIEAAASLLAELLPKTDWNDLRWRCLDIARAEPASPGGRRPDRAVIVAEQDIIAAWPTKLTLAPALADTVLDKLRDDGVEPAPQTDSPAVGEAAPPAPSIPAISSGAPPIAQPFWN